MRRKIAILIITFFLIIRLFLLQATTLQGSGFGIGILLGDPTGLSAKYWITGERAIDGAFAWSFKKDRVYLHGDYILHSRNILKVRELPILYGFGASIEFGRDIDAKNGADFEIALRIPVGGEYLFKTFPIGVSLEIAPTFLFYPETKGEIHGGIALRYYLDSAGKTGR